MATAQLYHRSPAVTPICLKSYTSPIAIHSWLKLERILTGLPISRSAIPGHFRKTARNWDTRMPHHPGLPLAKHDKNLVNTQKKRSTDILKLLRHILILRRLICDAMPGSHAQLPKRCTCWNGSGLAGDREACAAN